MGDGNAGVISVLPRPGGLQGAGFLDEVRCLVRVRIRIRHQRQEDTFQKLNHSLLVLLRRVIQVLQPQLQLRPGVLKHTRVPQDLHNQKFG